MSNARNLARVIVDSSGDIAAGNLDNAVPADGSITAAKLAASLDLSSKTLTYPDNSVQSADIASLAASKLSGQVPDANAPSGSVIQVVYANRDSNEVYTGSSTAITTNFSASITPLSTSSKILIIGSLCTRADGGDTNFGGYDLYRNGSSVSNNIATWSGNNENYQLSATYLDSPASTSSVTYTWYIRSAGSGHDVRFNPTPVGSLNARSTMILMEIAG